MSRLANKIKQWGLVTSSTAAVPETMGWQALMLAIFLVITLGVCSAPAQDNPFAIGAGDATTPPTTADADNKPEAIEEPEVPADASSSDRLLIRAVKQSNPEAPVDFARALKVMLDIRQYAHAKFYLNRLQRSIENPEQLVELHRAMGDDLFLLIHADPNLAPAGQQLARRVLEASRAAAESPQSIQQLIATLNDPSIAVRSSAFRQLRRLGPKATAALIAVFADPQRGDEFPGVRGALYNMGSDAVPLLIAAAHADDASVSQEALRALANYDHPDAAELTAVASLVPDLPAPTRAALQAANERVGRGQIDQARIESRLRSRIEELISTTDRSMFRGDQITTDWLWDSDRKELLPLKVSESTAARIRAARMASDLYRLRPLDADNRQLFLITQLEATKRLAGPTTYVTLDGLPKVLGTVTPTEIDGALGKATGLPSIPASIACCELLSEMGGPELFYQNSSKPCPIIQAIMVGDRRLQHAALRAIDKLNPTQAYAGCSYPPALAVYLASTQQRSAALVGHQNRAEALTLAGKLIGNGVPTTAASTGREVFAQSRIDPDLSFLLISDTMDRPVFTELVRQLRADYRTKRIPIGVYVRDQRNQSRSFYATSGDRLTMTIPAALDGDLLAWYAAQLRSLGEHESLGAVDAGTRYRHAEQAIQWLAKVAADRDRYSFYELGTHQNPLSQLLFLPGFAGPASQILASLGTPLSQRNLVDFASDEGIDVQDRQAAADALDTMIGEGSILLTRDQIRRQYDRYNSSPASAAASREVLGNILDSIEQKAKR